MADKETDASKKTSGSSSAKSAKSSSAPSNGEQKSKSSGAKSSKSPAKPAAAASKSSKSAKAAPDGQSNDNPTASSATTATQAPPEAADQTKEAPHSNGDSPNGGDSGNPESNLQQQRTSMILRAVLDEEETPPEVQAKRFRYHMYMDIALGVGLLVAMAGFTIGLFKMYVTHKAQQCIMECDYPAAIALLKGNPLPPVFSINGNDRSEDPEELLARALYLDAMHKLDDQNDLKGGLAELQQIRAGTHYFNEAQRILAENFEPSGTTLTGGVVENRATPPAKQ